jgi:hypothetical protein
MKAKIAILVVFLSLAACKKPEVVVAPPAPTPTPAPPIAVATPEPAPPERHLAVEGVFYLVSWVRVENSDGVTGLPPGTGVKLVRPGVYLTPAGEWPLEANQITNDLDVARQARDAGAAGQALAKQRQAIEEEKAAAADAAAREQAARSNDANLQGLDRTNLTRKLEALRQQKAVLQGQVSSYFHAVGQENRGRVLGRIEAGSSVDNLAGARAELRQVEGQIRDTEAALRRLK